MSIFKKANEEQKVKSEIDLLIDDLLSYGDTQMAAFCVELSKKGFNYGQVKNIVATALSLNLPL
jgi:hypothetical protein